jgi:hypothetical protein
MANEFKVKKGLIVDGTNTVLDIQGTQGQLFSVTDSLTGDLFSVSDISGIPILNVNSSGLVTIDGETTFTGGLTIPGYINHAGDSGTKFGFEGNDAFRLYTDSTMQLQIDSVGNSTFAGNVESEDTFILNYNNAGNKWQQLFDGANGWNLRYYNSTTQAWSSNYVTVNTSGNTTFAGIVTAGNGSQAVNNDAMLTLRAAQFSGLDIKSARTSGNIGGIRFYDTASNTVPEAQLNVEVDGSYNFYNGTNGAQLRLKIDSSGNSTFAGQGIFTGGGNTLTLKKGTGNAALTFAGTASDPEASGLIEGIAGGGLKFYTSNGGTIGTPAWSEKLTISAVGAATFTGSLDVGTFTLSGSGIVADAGMTLQTNAGGVNAITLTSAGAATFAKALTVGNSGTTRFTDTSSFPLQLNRGLAVDVVGTNGVHLGLGSYTTGTTYVDAARIAANLEYNGTTASGDLFLQVNNSGTYSNALSINNDTNATFAGNVTVEGGTLNLSDGSTYDSIINSGSSLTLNFDTDDNSTGEIFRINHNTTTSNANNLFSITEAGSATFAGNVDVDGGTLNVGASNEVSIVSSGSSHFPSLKVNNNGYLGSASVTDALKLLSSGDLQAKTKIGIGIDPTTLLHLKGTGDAIRVESTNTGAGGAQIDLLHYSTSPADNDTMAYINMGGYYDTTPSQAYFSSIRTVATDISARQGKLTFTTRNGSDFNEALSLTHEQHAVFSKQIIMESGTGGTTSKLILKTTDNSDESKWIRTNAYWVEHGGHANEGFKFIDTGSNILLQMNGGAQTGGNGALSATLSGSVFGDGGNIGMGKASTTPNIGYGMFHYSGIGLGIYSGAGGGNQGIGFWLNNGTSAYEAGRWLQNGNFGIGDLAPTSISSNTSSLSVNSSRSDLSGALINKANGSIKHQQYWDSSGYGFNLSASSGDFRWKVNNNERMTVNADGGLDIQGTVGQLFSVTNSLTGDLFSVSDISGVPIFNVNSSGLSNFDGNVLVGKTEVNNALVGVQLMTDGSINPTVSGDTVARFNRLSNDGEVIRIQKDTALIGAIGTYNGVPWIGYQGGAGGGIMFNGASIEPTLLGSSRSSNTNDIGSSTYKWRYGYFGTAVNTHDLVATNSAVISSPQSGTSNVLTVNHGAGSHTGIGVKINSANSGHAIDLSGSVGSGYARLTSAYGNNPDFYTSGTITAGEDVIAYSDIKLKENIKTLDGSKVYDMRGVSFTRKDTGKESSGVIAQEMQKVAPELVNEIDGTLGVSYGNLTGYLIEAIKDQQKQIDELKKIIKNGNNL